MSKGLEQQKVLAYKQLSEAQKAKDEAAAQLWQRQAERHSFESATNAQAAQYQHVSTFLSKYHQPKIIAVVPTVTLAHILLPEEMLRSTVLKEIIKAQSVEGFNAAIDRITDINFQDVDGWTLLIHAARSGFIYGVSQLLGHGAKICITDKHRDNALHIAIKSNQTPTAELLLKADDKAVSDRDGSGKLPVILCIEQVNHGIAKLAFDIGNSGLCNREALIYEATVGNEQVMRSLLDMAAAYPGLLTTLINFLDPMSGKSVLSIALENHQHQATALLMQRGANLIHAMQSNKEIPYLDLHGITTIVPIISDIADKLEHSSITYLDLSSTKVSAEAIYLIADVLKRTTSITYVNLSDNNLQYTAASTLSCALEDNRSIKHVDLSRNDLQDAGAILIAKAIGLKPHVPQHITALNLESTNMTDAGAILVAKALSDNHVLVYINLSNNHIGDRGIESLSDVLELNVSITSMDLSSNPFTAVGIGHLSHALEANSSIIAPLIVGSIARFGASEKSVMSEIEQKICQNQQNLKKVLHKLEAPMDLKTEVHRDGFFKELFIAFKHIQNADQSFLAIEGGFNKDIYLTRIGEVLSCYLSEAGPHHDEYAELLGASI